MSEEVQYIRVDAFSDGQRLDNFLMAHLKGVPKSHLYKLMRRGEVRVNKGRVKPDRKLQLEDIVRIPPIRTTEKNDETLRPSTSFVASLESAILYEDDDLIVLNKPSGMAVHGGSGLLCGVIEGLRAIRPAQGMELVHRLDRETSGCLLVAKSRKALLELHRQFRDGEIQKSYLGLCAGRWSNAIREINAPLLKNTLKSGERVVVTDQQGKESITHFRIERRFSEATLLDIQLDTGRTHQIRVHTQLAGCPLLGDDKYGVRELNRHFRSFGLKRLFLHARELRFVHPITAVAMDIKAPLPDDLEIVLSRLEG